MLLARRCSVLSEALSGGKGRTDRARNRIRREQKNDARNLTSSARASLGSRESGVSSPPPDLNAIKRTTTLYVVGFRYCGENFAFCWQTPQYSLLKSYTWLSRAARLRLSRSANCVAHSSPCAAPAPRPPARGLPARRAPRSQPARRAAARRSACTQGTAPG